MFRFTCPNCHHGLKARESLVGQNVRCPGCGNIITVPEPPAASDDPTASHPDVIAGERPGVGPGTNDGAGPPAVPAPHVPPVIVEPPPPSVIVVPVPVPVLVVTATTDEPALPGEPLPALSGPPSDVAVAVLAANHEAGETEHVPDPASPSSAPTPAIVAEDSPPAGNLSGAAPMAHDLSAIEVRSAYFAPAGYAGPERFAVRFLAPDLRRRLGPASDVAGPPEEVASPPAPPADPSAYLVTRTPRGAVVASTGEPPDGAIAVIDPVLAGVFLTHGEADPRVPGAAVRAYLEAPVVRKAALALRDRVLRQWQGGGPPLTAEDLLASARGLVDDAPTALLLCYNVTRAFAHCSIALSWHLLDPARGEYTDGATVYTAASRHPASVPGPADNPLFFLLFAAGELGAAVPAQWPRYFAIATAAAYAAAARLVTADTPATPFVLAWSRAVEAVTGAIVDRAQPPRPDYRAWLWAAALSSVSMTGLPPGAEERSAAALADLRAAAALGLAQAGATVNLAWRWDLPSVDVCGLAAAR